jgi:hypothetical protein
VRARIWMLLCASAGLLSCGTLPARDVRPATDLDLLTIGVEELTREREPQSRVTRAEDVTTVEEAGELLIALEDVDWLHEDDKRRLRRFVTRSVERIRISLEPPCQWWNVSCKMDQRGRRQDLEPPEPLPDLEP